MNLAILMILGSIGLGIFLFFVIPKPFRLYLQYRLMGFKHKDIPKTLIEDYTRNNKWWRFWR